MTTDPRKQRHHGNKLHKRLRRNVGQAIEDFNMIEEGRPGDGLPVRGQGLLHAAGYSAQPARSAPVDFELTAINLDQKQPGFPADVLPRYLEQPGVHYHIIEQDTYSVVKRVIPEGKTMCGLCSRLRRGILYRYAARTRHDQDRAWSSPRRHHRDPVPEPVSSAAHSKPCRPSC